MKQKSSRAAIVGLLTAVSACGFGGWLPACDSGTEAPGGTQSDATTIDAAPAPTYDGGGPVTADGITSPVQFNDLTVVFPLPSPDDMVRASIKPSDVGARGVLIPVDLYTSVLGEPATLPNPPAGIAKLPYDQMRVVAFRLDPCFAHIGPIATDATCTNQVRLVFQPIRRS
jgi:hypothetical protein